ncbi:MAG: methylmalonyl Co-A mutase-associated GTPase MeaB [Deltaproteobacteria bacterium]|nr:methylmalonyl Co-A mutase-associated GTPase MeaB [Deltaproteobacteria bacterium]
MDSIEAVLSGSVRDLAILISKVENGDPEGWKALRLLYPHTGKAVVIGLTGPPGAGKSSLINRMIHAYLGRGLKVAVLAVDPSSPFTGGGVLGDRVRMPQLNPNLFIRSLATRGQLGGLSRTAGSIIKLLDAAGYQRIIIETVGTGQAEVAIKHYAHTVLVLTIPNMGDDIQTLKSGILEIGDIYVVNKADLPGADRVEAELQDMLCMRGDSGPGWRPPVLYTVAREGRGIESLMDQVENHREFLMSKGMLSAHRRRLAEFELTEGLKNLMWERAFKALDRSGAWGEACERVAQGKLDPWLAVQQLSDGLSRADAEQKSSPEGIR